MVYNPVRESKHVKMAKDPLHYVKFVAASEEEWAEKAAAHFQEHGMKTRTLEKPETLEVAKLGETTYFGVIIAWAQEFNRYVQRAGGDYEEAIEFFEEVAFLPRASDISPGFIGGHYASSPTSTCCCKWTQPLCWKAVVDSNERRAVELKEEAAEKSSELPPELPSEAKVLAHR